MKLSQARRDYYRKLAKNDGYRSRSAYKLKQLNNSYHIFKSHNKVVDLGCAPGGWLQVLEEEIGNQGKIIGIDQKEVLPLKFATILQGSIEDPYIVEKIIEVLNGRADVVLSDLAPNVSGIWDIDHARQISLTRSALTIVRKLLRKNGSAIFKVFEGEMLKQLKEDLAIHFENVHYSKPDASRRESSELYMICLNFRS
ncbi:MAG: rlmE [Nitrososphaeraceae archaeon]|jgi:23S rRNA (uridine2552-2'-O)-methyltransferase|nr:rlmE [Nitrososphaeraceae archaeon]MDF2767278.1 rlmE [Nitrososphaeraceae archaeon]